MNHDEVKKVSIERMAFLEDCYQDYVPAEIQQFYLLNFLLAHKLDAYLETYGTMSLDQQSCEDGKLLSGLSPLNPFEIDCINFLNNAIARREQQNKHRANLSLISHR